MSDKKKFHRTAAIVVAMELATALKPFCHEGRLTVAGSLRRRKQEVSDVEILYVPRIDKPRVERASDLFEPTPMIDKASERLEELLVERVLAKRKNINGSETWGPKNKLALHVASGIPVDFFATTEECFFMALVIRTGPKELNLRLIDSAAKRGLKLHAYGVFERTITGESIVPKSEREVFEIAGLPYMEPLERK